MAANQKNWRFANGKANGKLAAGEGHSVAMLTILLKIVGLYARFTSYVSISIKAFTSGADYGGGSV